jgi:hypothetical protein
VILHNECSRTADVYIENNMPDPEFMCRLPWNYRDGKVNYHFKYVFFFEDRAKHSYYMQNISDDNLFIAAYDL